MLAQSRTATRRSRFPGQSLLPGWSITHTQAAASVGKRGLRPGQGANLRGPTKSIQSKHGEDAKNGDAGAAPQQPSRISPNWPSGRRDRRIGKLCSHGPDQILKVGIAAVAAPARQIDGLHLREAARQRHTRVDQHRNQKVAAQTAQRLFPRIVTICSCAVRRPDEHNAARILQFRFDIDMPAATAWQAPVPPNVQTRTFECTRDSPDADFILTFVR